MADVKKVVEIALNIVGADTKTLKTVLKSFEAVQKSVDTTTKSIDNFKTKLNSIKVPTSLKKIENSFKSLNSLKLPNLTRIADNLKKLNKVQPPPLGSFVNNLTKLSKITKFPSVIPLVNGLKKIAAIRIAPIIAKIKALNASLTKLQKQGGISAFKNFARDVNVMQSAFARAATSMNKMQTIMKKTGDTAQQSGLKLRSFADKVRTVLQFRVISGAILAVNDTIRTGITAIIEYDQALKDLQAITGATTLEVAQMGLKILQVASTTKFSAQEIAQGMRTIGQAGFNASEAIETMQAVSDLATGTLSEMGTTVDLVTTAMRVFQIDATRSSEIADVFANSVNKSKLTIDKLRTSMNYIGPIARDAGVTFKELAASMGVLANSGLRASTIGTGLRRVFAELIDPSKKLKAAAKAVGISLNELDPRATSLSEVIANLGLVVKDAQIAFDVFGKRGAAAVLALSGTGSKFQEMLGLVSRSGTAANQAAIQMEGLGVSLKNLQDKLGLLAIAFGDLGITDAMMILINISRTLVDVLTSLMNTTFSRFIGKSALLVGALVLLKVAFSFIALTILPALGTALGFVASAFTGLAASIGVATFSIYGLQTALGPIALILVGIAAAAVAIFSSFKDGAAAASEQAAVLADEYDILEKKLRDYGETTVNMKEKSKELKEETLKLRKQLLEVAKGITKVAEAARLAASKINPLTGEFLDGKEALEAYNEELNKFQTEELIKALKEAGKSLDTQMDNINRWVNRWKDAFSQINIYAKAGIATLRDILNFDVEKIPGRWTKAWKDAVRQGKEIKKGLDLSKALDAGTASIEDLRNAIKTFDMSNLTAQQAKLVKSYEALNERAIKFAQHQRDIGKISLRDTVENIEQLAKDAGLVGLELQAVVEEFKRLKDANKDTFSNIIEKWEKDADPQFLTNLVDGFNKVGGAIDATDKAALAQIENQRELRIQELNNLKETILIAKASGRNMAQFWAEYYEKEQAILKRVGEDRKVLANNVNAQNLIDYAREMDALNKHLGNLRETFKYNEEQRGREIAAARAASEKRIQAIITGDDVGNFKDQTAAYKLNLKEREAAHAKFILTIKTLEANKSISEEVAEKRKLNSNLNFYKQSLSAAKEYRDKINEGSDPEEYQKRQNIVLAAEKKFYVEKARIISDLEDIQDETVNSRIEARSAISESIYKAALKKRKEAQKTLISELKLEYERDLINISEYYDERRSAAQDDYDLKKELIEKEIKNTKSLFDDKIKASNSEIEQDELKTKKMVEVSELKQQLNKIDQERIRIVNELTGSEIKETNALKDKADAIIRSIEKRSDAAIKASSDTTFEDKQEIELAALDARNALEIEKLEKLKADEATIENASQLQANIRRELEKSQEEALYEHRFNLAKDFATNSANVFKDLVNSGLIQSKKAWIAYQAFAIAETVVSTIQGAQDAFTSLAKVPYVGPILGAAAAAAAIAAGFARVAQIRAERPSYAEGGEIQGYSPHSKADNITIDATSGEYMQPVSAVRKYGRRVMNAIRSLSIPKEALQNLIKGTNWGLSTPIPSFALADGGIVKVSNQTQNGGNDRTLSNINRDRKEREEKLTIINVVDPNMIDQHLYSARGQKAILNVVGAKYGKR